MKSQDSNVKQVAQDDTFYCLPGIGIYNAAVYHPTVFAAISPIYAVDFFIRNGWDAWRMLGGILLCVTGWHEDIRACKRELCWLIYFLSFTRGKPESLYYTGTEAMFADLGHFNIASIQVLRCAQLIKQEVQLAKFS